MSASPKVTGARIGLVAHPWERLRAAGGAPHEHAFQRGSGGDRVATVAGNAGGVEVERRHRGLVVLKTTGSGWEGYQRDRVHVAPETDDRIMATEVTTAWTTGRPTSTSTRRGTRSARRDARARSATTTARRCSSRFTGWARRCSRRARRSQRITFSLPNKHHLLYDLSRFGLENDHEIFHATDEPYGLIEGTVEREPAERPAVEDNGAATVRAAR